MAKMVFDTDCAGRCYSKYHPIASTSICFVLFARNNLSTVY